VLQPAFYGMVFGGAALMVYNIYSFVRFARYVRGQKSWKQDTKLLYVPIILLILFLTGYLVVGAFGEPNLVVGGILFGGSIFVFIMYKLLNSITLQIMENERREAKLQAGMNAHLSKPIEPERLYETLARTIAGENGGKLA